MDIQAMMNAMSDIAQSTRKDYHMSLGELIDFLNTKCEGDQKVVLDYDSSLGVSSPHSYRGYYSDLAIEPSEQGLKVGELLDALYEVLDTELTGYKGEEFLMDSSVPVWVSFYGSLGRALMSAVIFDNTVILVTKEVD
jgi:hypothetical protein